MCSSATEGNKDKLALDSITEWIATNEERKPTLVKAAIHLLSKMAFKVPLDCATDSRRCIELCPRYVSNISETSPQTVRNAWTELRLLLGWNELSGRKGIEGRLAQMGYSPRNPGRGKRWGTHIFMDRSLMDTIRAFVCWCYQTGKVQSYKVQLPLSAISIVRSVLYKNDPPSKEVTNKDKLSPQTPQRGRRRTRNRKTWEKHDNWVNATIKERMGLMMSYMLKKEIPASQRRRRSWLRRMESVHPQLRWGLYRPNEDMGTDEHIQAMCLLAEGQGMYVSIEDDVQIEPDEWYGVRDQLLLLRYGNEPSGALGSANDHDKKSGSIRSEAHSS